MQAGNWHRRIGAVAAIIAGTAAPPALAGKLTIIHGFRASANLGGGIVAGPDGTLYGVLSFGGGCGNAGCVYALSPPAQAGGAWQYATIHQFGHKDDGNGPQGQLTLGPNGELYGQTGSGILYRLTPPQSGTGTWGFTKLAALADGFRPNSAAPLLFSNKVLYGISQGGSQTCPYVGCGGVFAATPDQSDHWQVTTIAAFDGGSLGGSPSGFVGPDASGGFYVANQYRGKIVYLVPFDSRWQANVAASFPRSEGLGCLVMGTSGAVYGVAGSYFRGRLFQIQPNSGSTQWTISTLADINDHQNAPCPEIQGPGGSLIGTVFGDQDAYDGDIFQLSPPAAGTGDWTYKILTKIGRSGRYGPDNAVTGLGGNLYAPVNSAYGPPAAIVQYRVR